MKTAEIKVMFDSLIVEKIDEVRDRIKYFKSEACELSKNTKSTQLFQKNKELKTLRLIRQLLNDEVDDKGKDTLISLTTLISERQFSIVDFNEGDSFIDIAYNKYKDVKHISDKIEKVCEKKGLKLDTKTGIFVKS